MTIDGYYVTALVDTGADYSVISSNLAEELKKVLTHWNGPHIRTAGGHIAPTSRCTARVGIRGYTYVADFIVLPECSRDVKLVMDFLQANGAVIDLQTSTLTFSTAGAIATNDAEGEVRVLRVVDDNVVVPPRSSVVVLVKGDVPECCDRLVEGKTNLL